MNGEVYLLGITDEELLPLRGNHSSPAGYTIVIYRERRVWYDQAMINAYHFTEAFTLGACTDRIIETKHLGRRLLKDSSPSLKYVAELLYVDWLPLLSLHLLHSKGAYTTSLEERCLYRLSKPVYGRAILADSKTVDE